MICVVLCYVHGNGAYIHNIQANWLDMKIGPIYVSGVAHGGAGVAHEGGE